MAWTLKVRHCDMGLGGGGRSDRSKKECVKKTARGPKNSNSHAEQLYNQTCGISNTVINTLSPRFDRQTLRLRGTWALSLLM